MCCFARRWGRCRSEAAIRAGSIADEAEIEVAVVAAGFGHFFYFLPRFFLGVVVHAIFRAIPFFQEGFHLQVIEYGLAEGVDAAEQEEIRVGSDGDYAVEHDPLAALAEIVFEFHDQGHSYCHSDHAMVLAKM